MDGHPQNEASFVGSMTHLHIHDTLVDVGKVHACLKMLEASYSIPALWCGIPRISPLMSNPIPLYSIKASHKWSQMCLYHCICPGLSKRNP